MSLASELDHKLDPADVGSVKDFFDLLKPRVMSLVIFTAAVGMAVAPTIQHPFIALMAILSIAIGAGASGALNMWYDADIDVKMSRTQNRPIPSGRIDRGSALGFGLTLSILSVMTLGLATNWVAGGLLAFTIFFYAVIYTMLLKRWTAQNIVIGGAAGAFPPMVGWAAMTGTVSLESVILFALIFLWTPPHFWALALYKQSDYHAANIPMMPNVAGEKSTIMQMFVYSILLVATAALPTLIGQTSWLYFVFSSALGGVFVVLSFRLFGTEGKVMKARAKQLFSFSLLYLFAIFLAVLLDVGAQRWGIL